MISSTFRQFETSWKGSLWLTIQKFDIYHEFELKNFWAGVNYTVEAFLSLLFVNGVPKGNFRKYWLFWTELADVSKIKQVTAGKVCFPDFFTLAYIPIKFLQINKTVTDFIKRAVSAPLPGPE